MLKERATAVSKRSISRGRYSSSEKWWESIFIRFVR